MSQVVNYDAEKVFALGWSANLLCVLNASGDAFLELVEGRAYVELSAEPVDEDAFGIEDEDDEFKGGVDFAVGGAEEGDVGGLDGVVDAVAAEGTVDFFRQDVVGCGGIFGLRGGAGGNYGHLHDDFRGCG